MDSSVQKTKITLGKLEIGSRKFSLSFENEKLGAR